MCHQVLNALSINGNNVRYWLFEGCFKYEIYQSKESVTVTRLPSLPAAALCSPTDACCLFVLFLSSVCRWIKPCPSHVMCSVLKDLSAAPFCPALPMENPFADA